MAAAAVLPAGKQLATMDVDTTPSTLAESEDLYTRLKTLQRQLEFLEIQVHNWGTAELQRIRIRARRRSTHSSRVSAALLIAPVPLYAGGIHQGGAEEP